MPVRVDKTGKQCFSLEVVLFDGFILFFFRKFLVKTDFFNDSIFGQDGFRFLSTHRNNISANIKFFQWSSSFSVIYIYIKIILYWSPSSFFKGGFYMEISSKPKSIPVYSFRYTL